MQAISDYLYQIEDSTALQSDVIRETKIRRALMEILKLDIRSFSPLDPSRRYSKIYFYTLNSPLLV